MIIRKGETQTSPSSFQFRRMPAVPRKISEINAEKDVRVRLLGRVIDKYDGSVVVDDGSAKAEIVVEDTNVPFAEINSGELLRIFARVLPLETTFELRAEIVQKMSEAFMDLNKKVYG